MSGEAAGEIWNETLLGVKGLNDIVLHYNPFTPKSDQFQISRAASPEIQEPHAIKNLAFHSLLRWKMIILPILTTPLIYFSLYKIGRM